MSDSIVDSHSSVWEADPELQARLELAGWRYANLIGVTQPGPDDVEQARCLAEDRLTHGILLKSACTEKVWNAAEATGFVAEVAGTSREIAAAWLDYDWNGGGAV